MKNLSDLKLRIKAVKDTLQITKAMDTVSSAKMRKAMAVLKDNQNYFDRIQECIQDMVNYTASNDNKYLNPTKQGKSAYIVISSDKGLCGSYNNKVLKFANERLKEEKMNQDTVIFAVGLMTKDYFENLNYNVSSDFIFLSSIASHRDSIKMADKIELLYSSEQLSSVKLIFTQASETGQYKPQIINVLPIIKQNNIVSMQDEEYFKELQFEPSIEVVMQQLVKQYLIGIFFGALAHCSVCEHTSRRISMKTASDNAEKVLVSMIDKSNQIRQEQITEDIATNERN
ncbi:MAG: F0F1 ATP synthase subunit gamma [Clostridiales bacterium]|jgi:F-type H+-transporting ATPase subunit gamma|nr:F0F1 ATP synthase subunit gamma [Clostridiales bacterium]